MGREHDAFQLIGVVPLVRVVPFTLPASGDVDSAGDALRDV
ncbi:MAG TPA: hypothetical protein VL485_02805 [Ktedonobacteraceae bacterium]|jgi:hypothetical protein|nr:hypothetical protein [Ktedonobacteraceae bacterium]